MSDQIIDRIVESLAAGDMSVDEFLGAVEERTQALRLDDPPGQENLG